MNEKQFQSEMSRAQSMARLGDSTYWNAYMRGLRRAFHGSLFGTDEEHAAYMASEDERGRGYRDGYNIPTVKKSIGERIRGARNEAGISQTVLAEKCGLRIATISDIERGNSNVTIETLVAIANALGVSVNHFTEDGKTQTEK